MPPLRSKLISFGIALSFACSLASASPARAADLAGPPTVLGIEKTSDADAQAAFDLTEALRTEMGRRGEGGGADLSLLELRLTMACEGNDPACLAEGGKTIEADTLIYGSVKAEGEQFAVELSRLDVATAQVAGSLTRDLPRARFASPEALRTLATELIDELYGKAPAPAPAVVAPAPAVADPAQSDELSEDPEAAPPPPREGGLIWGRDPAPPRWKWIGLGVSAGLAAASLGTAIGTTVAIRPGGPVRRDLERAADDSLTDGSTSNDVDRSVVDDLCAYGREEINPAEPGAVRNAEVTRVCDRGDALATTATVTWITTGVFLASTAVFTTLLFVRKKDSKAARALHERGVSLGGAPTPDGGLMVGGRMAF